MDPGTFAKLLNNSTKVAQLRVAFLSFMSALCQQYIFDNLASCSVEAESFVCMRSRRALAYLGSNSVAGDKKEMLEQALVFSAVKGRVFQCLSGKVVDLFAGSGPTKQTKLNTQRLKKRLNKKRVKK